MARPKADVTEQPKKSKIYTLQSKTNRICHFAGYEFIAQMNEDEKFSAKIEISENEYGKEVAQEIVQKLQECGAFQLINTKE